jgi:type IV secretory pathway ATPase VirB11/archaellum biosynthesis ATPase
MRIFITVGELLSKGKLEIASRIFPDMDFTPADLTREIELTEDQAGRLGLVNRPTISDFPNLNKNRQW